jgi:predicted lysophospholipase L1 biosynthesis ABC-type transport system permease subunit
MSPLRAIDDFLYANVTRRWPKERIDSYTRRLKSTEADALLPEPAHRAFENLDSKSASLLTHVSMMIAAIGITATLVAETKLEQGFMIVQIMVYLLIAVICLRCSSLFRGATDENLPADELGRELILRRELYSLSNSISIYLTVLVLLTLPVLAYI